MSILRVVLALLMGVGVVTHVYLKVNSPNPNWLIFMTNQVRIHSKHLVWTFLGNCLAGCPLHPTCLAGPLGEVQVVVGKLLPFNIPGVQSRMAAHSLSSISSPGVLRWKWKHFFHSTPPSSEHGLYCYSLHHCSLLDSGTPLLCGVQLAEGLASTELMKGLVHAFLDTTGRVHDLLCACPQYGNT